MRRTAFAAPILSLLSVATATAQPFPQTFPDHTVVGRLGTGSSSGPWQAIPFNALAIQLFNSGANTVLCNATATPAAPIGCSTLPSGLTIPTPLISGLVTANLTAPNWTNFTGLYQGAIFNLGSLPTSAMQDGSVPLPQALVGAIDVPSDVTASDNFINAGVAGYARTGSTSPAVALFGVGLVSAGPANAWGINTIVSNAATMAGGTETGFNLGSGNTIYGAEFDVNVWKTSTGGTPTGGVRGIAIYGGGEIVPSGGAYAIEIGSFTQAYQSAQPWTGAIIIDGAPNGFGIQIGPAGAAGVNSVGSQTLVFQSRNPSGTTLSSVISTDDGGDFVFNPPSDANIALQDGNGTTLFETVPGLGGSEVTINKLTTAGMLCNAVTTGLVSSSTTGCSGLTLGAASGGTGVANNSANTITFSGNYGLTITLTGATSVTLPTSGSLAPLASPAFTGTVGLPQYAISGLPTCNSGLEGATAYVTNGQSSPSFLGTVSSTGSVIAPVFCNGSGWVYG